MFNKGTSTYSRHSSCRSCCADMNKLSRSRRKRKIYEYNKKWRHDNREAYNACLVAWKKANPDRMSTLRAKDRVKRRNNPGYILHTNIGSLLRNFLRGATKKTKFFDIVGYTAEEFRNHIELQFTEGMSWENWGEWHIDHIKPLSLFYDDSRAVTEIIKDAWSLSNMQPLWAFDNLSKSNKWEAA